MAEQLITGITCNDNATPVLERFRRTVTEVSNSSIGSFATMGLIAGGVAKGISMIGDAIEKGLGPSMEMEKLQVQFKVLLGSTSEAKKRMEELSKFADTTPFELTEVAKASKTLETLTKGALSTGKGLTLVGDAAAASGVPFDELSVHIGRLYDGLDSGRPVGESLSRLQELGLVSGETRGEIEKLQKEGKKGPEVWGVAAKALGQYSGMMGEQAQTMEGLASTMQDSLAGVLREFGNQLLPDAKTATKELTETLNDLKPAAEVVGFVVGSVVKLFNAALIGLKAFATVAIPTALGGLGMLLMDSLSTVIGWAKSVTSIFGKILPDSWAKSLDSGLTSAENWSKGMSGYFSDVVSDAGVQGELLSEKLADIYRTPDAEDDTGAGKKKTKSKVPGTSGDGKARAKEIEDAQKALEQIVKGHQKADDEIAKIRAQMVLDSISDEKEKETTALNQKVKAEQDSANGNKELLKAIQDKYRQDIALINKKYDKIEVQDRLKALDKQIDAEQKRNELTKENLKKSEEQLKEVLAKEQATIDAFSSKASSLLTGPFDSFNKSIMSGNRSLKGSFSDLFSNIQDNFGNMLSQMVAQLMTKAAIFGVLNLLSGGGVSAATTGLSNFSWFASGTDYAYGGPSVVGENGPEILDVPRGSKIKPNNQISNYTTSGGNTYQVTVTKSGVDANEIVQKMKLMERQNSRTRRG